MRALFLTGFLLAAVPSFAAELRGVVFLGDYPVPSAAVRLLGTPLATSTGRNGAFSFPDAPLGAYTLRCMEDRGAYRNVLVIVHPGVTDVGKILLLDRVARPEADSTGRAGALEPALLRRLERARVVSVERLRANGARRRAVAPAAWAAGLRRLLASPGGFRRLPGRASRSFRADLSVRFGDAQGTVGLSFDLARYELRIAGHGRRDFVPLADSFLVLAVEAFPADSVFVRRLRANRAWRAGS